MNCQEFLSHLPSYPDAVQDQLLLAEMRKHAAECPACEKLLSQQEKMLADLNRLDDVLEVPDAFANEWRENIRQSAPAARVAKRWRTWMVSAAAVLTLLAGTAMMREGVLFQTAPEEAVYGYGDVDVQYDAEYTSDQSQSYSPSPMLHKAAMTGGGAVTNGAVREAVVLHTASVNIQTEQYDQDIAHVEALLSECGGWTEYQSVYGEALSADGTGRNASMTLRVPMEALDAFLEAANAIGRVTGSEKTAQDITENYYDTKARLTMYEAQRDRLVELLAKAENLSDIIDIESRMNELQYTIESLQGTLNSWNSRAENAVVYISLSEVSRGATKVPLTLGERLAATVDSSIKGAWAFAQDMLVFLIMAAPYLALLAVVALVGFCVHKNRKNRR